MVHGGCWQKAIADRTLMNYAAADLRARGLAVWNIEYRGTDEEGGGYPGTFNDVADAGLLLLTEGEELGLDPSRIAGFGHSAGGHLIAWLALRHRIEGQGPLATDEPFPLRGAVLSGHLADLEEAEPVTLADCLASVRETLTGPPDELRSDPYADTSPGRLLPADLPLFSVHGREDQIAPGSLATSFSTRAGALAHSVIVPETGHVELIAPGSAAWDVQAALLAALLAPEPGSAVVLDKTAKRRQLP
jgi:acetyl esterase/lipase